MPARRLAMVVEDLFRLVEVEHTRLPPLVTEQKVVPAHARRNRVLDKGARKLSIEHEILGAYLSPAGTSPTS